MEASLIPKSKAKTAYGLLTEIRALILAEPKRYDQWDVLTVIRAKDRDMYDDSLIPACGTIGCVAGWVTALKTAAPHRVAALNFAQRTLGLSSEQADMLFDCAAAGSGESQTPEHAEAGAAHIAAFQKANRAQLLAKKV